MEHYEIYIWFSKRFNCIKVCDKKMYWSKYLSSGQYSVSKNEFKTPMLRADLCDYTDAYIVVKGRISVTWNNNASKRNKKLIFKNNAPFRWCKSKINAIFIDNAEDLWEPFE